MKVVLPFYSGDSWLLDKNLMWYRELDGKLDYDCFLAADDSLEKMDGYVALARTIFRSVNVIRYPRHRYSHWPFQQNNAFTNVAWAMAKQKDPWLWMETDAVPVKKGWIDTLRQEYEKGKKPFGGHWNSDAKIFNGVAIYPPNVSFYSVKMMMASITEGRDRDGKVAQSPWDAAGSKQVFPHLHIMNHVMQHIWDIDGVSPTFKTGDDVARLVRPEVSIFHRCKDGTLIDRLRDPGRIGSKARCVVGLETVHLKTGETKLPTKQNVPKGGVKASIFIVSFRGDFDWLPYLFKSIERHCSRFLEVVLAIPKGDAALLPKLAGSPKVVEFPEDGFISTFMVHLWAKMNADKFCAGDIIIHVDSDCVFISPTTPESYLTVDGRCINLCTTYAELGNTVPWQSATEKALGRKVEFETMRRHGCCYPRETYQAVRDHFEKVNRRPMREYLEAVPARGTSKESFSEFNTLGSFGMYFMPERFKFINTSKEPTPPNPILQFWSMKRASHPEVQKVLAQHKLL